MFLLNFSMKFCFIVFLFTIIWLCYPFIFIFIYFSGQNIFTKKWHVKGFQAKHKNQSIFRLHLCYLKKCVLAAEPYFFMILFFFIINRTGKSYEIPAKFYMFCNIFQTNEQSEINKMPVVRNNVKEKNNWTIIIF